MKNENKLIKSNKKLKNKKTKNKMGLGLLISIIATIFTLIGVVISLMAIQTSKDIAIKSGAFDKPNAVLLMANELILSSFPQDLIFGIKSKPNSVQLGRLPLVLKNCGKKSLKHVSITVRYPNIVNIAVPNEYAEFDLQGPFFTGIKRKVDRVGNFDYSSLFMEEINPGQSIFVGDIFSLQNTKTADTFPIGDQIFAYESYFSIELLISISAEDIPAIDYKVNLFGFQAENMEDLKKVLSKYLSKKSSSIRKKTNILQYLSLWLIDKEKKCILVYPQFTKVKIPNSTDAFIFSPTKNPNDDKFSVGYYRLLSFSKIFKY